MRVWRCHIDAALARTPNITAYAAGEKNRQLLRNQRGPPCHTNPQLLAVLLSMHATCSQVGNWTDDRTYWGRAEDATSAKLSRPVYTIDLSKPGADVAAQTAAALAAVAATLGEGEEPALMARLMRHARWLFAFAKQVRLCHGVLVVCACAMQCWGRGHSRPPFHDSLVLHPGTHC